MRTRRLINRRVVILVALMSMVFFGVLISLQSHAPEVYTAYIASRYLGPGTPFTNDAVLRIDTVVGRGPAAYYSGLTNDNFYT